MPTKYFTYFVSMTLKNDIELASTRKTKEGTTETNMGSCSIKNWNQWKGREAWM